LPFPFEPCELPGPDWLGGGDDAAAAGDDASSPALSLPLLLVCPKALPFPFPLPLPLPVASLDDPEPLPLPVDVPLPPPPEALEEALPPELVDGRLGVGDGCGLPLLAELEPSSLPPLFPEFEAGVGSAAGVAGAAGAAGAGEATGVAGLLVVGGALGERVPRVGWLESGPTTRGAAPARVGAADKVGTEAGPPVVVVVGARPKRVVPSSARPESEASLTTRGRPPLPPLEERQSWNATTGPTRRRTQTVAAIRDPETPSPASVSRRLCIGEGCRSGFKKASPLAPSTGLREAFSAL